MRNKKNRIEKLERIRGADKIKIIRRDRGDDRTDEELEAKYPDHKIIIIERKEMKPAGNAEIEAI